VTTTTAAARENERKRGRATGQEAEGPAHHAKKRRSGVHQVMCTREEREGVTGGATGGQRRGRMKGKTRGEEGRAREAHACM
jgi:hypothetical protein